MSQELKKGGKKRERSFRGRGIVERVGEEEKTNKSLACKGQRVKKCTPQGENIRAQIKTE